MEDKLKKLIDWLSNQPKENWVVDIPQYILIDKKYKFIVSVSQLSIYSKDYSMDRTSYKSIKYSFCQSISNPCINDLYLSLKDYNERTQYEKVEKLLDDILTSIK